MLSSNDAVSYVNLARQYLVEFVEKSGALYGRSFISLNVHNLVHISDDVENLQCNLTKISAFPYESTLGQIKKV